MDSLRFGNWMKSSGAALSRLGAVSLALACVVVICSQSNRAAATPPAGYDHLVFNENFNGDSVNDTSFRYHETGYGGSVNTTDAVTVDNGLMTIKVYSTADDVHWGGSVSTQQTDSYAYGYTEARIKFNNSQGCNMAYWLQGDAMFWDPPGVADDGIEIDIIEQRHTKGDNQNIQNNMEMTLHAQGYDEEHYQHNNGETIANLEDTWHVIGCLWNEDGYTFYCDDNEVWSYEPTWFQDWRNGEFKTKGPEWLLFNVNPCGGWAGDLLTN